MLSIIVAFDKNQIIGKNNKMPWHYKEDLQYFKEQTLNHTVVMGSNTYQSIMGYLNKPLPNRHSVVLTRHQEKFPMVDTYPSVEAFLDVYKDRGEHVFIIGGASIYEQFIDLVDRLYITHIDKDFEGDVYFPTFDYQDFDLIAEQPSGELRFCIYERKVNIHE